VSDVGRLGAAVGRSDGSCHRFSVFDNPVSRSNIAGMSVARFAVSFDQKLARAVRRASGKEPLSSWLADAAQRKLRAEGLLKVVGEWEAEHGRLNDTELQAAERRQRRRRR
jgi:hypothetical protein